jgi:hypothetical protein
MIKLDGVLKVKIGDLVNPVDGEIVMVFDNRWWVVTG